MQTKYAMPILWRNTNKETYQHGSRIQFHSNGTYFENQLMPSGLQIHLWTMTTQFDQDGCTPNLPILKRGGHYRLIFEVEAHPVESVYFILTFYRKNDTKIKQLMMNHGPKDFEYPKEAYRYDIRMMNASCHRLTFKRMVLTEVQLNDDIQPTLACYDDMVKQVNHIIQRTRALQNANSF
ncbi:accessory Sec system protein Asp3 [Staphylococcus intermedius]|uniref:Accessory Sec system asp3 n=1 Tax=Staphylococcus intermedius NCTC 11048 TaxID=1141106 RepID=A0A380G379_STAIN|nr:accessory Sec system protein Asp3 [Staphylococcus intermedius]PCF64216.1 accessory Sec system protein Asp3 [Staphylococcus intermedius]PCF78931.1 accessory Sec system protein Asp3 [Staphylococcus intermedius]PCF79903.1 accessory Sec system protein Asp3 [Staphylococcus intermedius]PCF89437.1 accessory Sec system protein Asp3 [Staphylococcus intermedius]PNZ50919.1 accessory Sec system protein Asp3 [Staphylococcus intermedius NCTC 11048]